MHENRLLGGARIYKSVSKMKTESRMRAAWLHGFITCVVGGALLLMGGCEYRARTDGDTVSPDSLLKDGPSQVSLDAKFTMNRGGTRRAIIQADQMQQYTTDDSTYSVWRTLRDTSRVRSFVFDEQGDSSATIIADSVLYYTKEGRFEAYGNVVVETDDGKRLESEHLRWNQFDRTIRTRRFVRITTPTEDVRGNGLVADEDLETYQIGRFTAEVEVDEEESQ